MSIRYTWNEIILAARFNRIEIIQKLLLNGDRISKPHDFHCKCTECINRFKFDSLRHAQSRLNAYRGLTSEAYISLASIEEKYFKHEYLQLRHSLSIYSVKLLNYVRGRDELDIVLNKTGKESKEKYEQLARLELAIRFQQKHVKNFLIVLLFIFKMYILILVCSSFELPAKTRWNLVHWY